MQSRYTATTRITIIIVECNIYFLMKYEVYKYAEIRLDIRLIRGFDITFSLASVDKTTIFLVLVG